MGKTFKDRKENREFNKIKRSETGTKMNPYIRSKERNKNVQSDSISKRKTNRHSLV